jgi:hypothetical protein
MNRVKKYFIEGKKIFSRYPSGRVISTLCKELKKLSNKLLSNQQMGNGIEQTSILQRKMYKWPKKT